jgi:hypothetical protein
MLKLPGLKIMICMDYTNHKNEIDDIVVEE